MKINLKNINTFYISLDEQSDRRDALLDNLKSVGIEHPIRMPGIRNEKYYIGLAQAYRNALLNASSIGSPFLLLEDDARTTEVFEHEIEIPDDADAIYLGISNWGVPEGPKPRGHALLGGVELMSVQGYDNLFKIKNALTTHAIVHITDRYVQAAMASLLRASEVELEYLDVQFYNDGLFEDYNVYVIGPMFYQHDLHKPENITSTRDINLLDFVI
jgi:hypothetical protein